MEIAQLKGYVGIPYLQAVAQLLAPIKKRSFALMNVQSGQTVLDVGCGPGIDTLVLAGLIGAKGRIIGIDHDAAMVAEANQRALQAGVSGFVKHQQSDATSLAFASDTFDSCRSERLFMHLSHPAKTLSEMKRVTKSGGWIVVLDMDWGSVSVDTNEQDVERRLARFRAEQVLHNGYAGRQLYRLFKQQNLAEVTLEVFPIYGTDYALMRYLSRMDEVESKALVAGIINQDDLQRWRADLEQAAHAGYFFASATLVVVAGHKPH